MPPATITLALAGDTMLGRSVTDRLRQDPAIALVDGGVAEAAAGADLFVLNLECCISERGERFPDPRKPFFFRALPVAAERLAELGVDAVLITPHWGPNMRTEPLPYIRAASAELVRAGAKVVAGHSAHVFQGVAGRVLFDLGDFLDDYAVNAELRNDLGLLWLVTLDAGGPTRVEALPLVLDFCDTWLARGSECQLVGRLLRERCAALGPVGRDDDARLVVEACPDP